MLLEGEGVDVEEAETAEAALDRLRRAPPIETILMDVRLPGMDGITAMQKLAAKDGTLPCPVIMISGHASLEEAVRATHLGSFDFFEKPLDRARVLVSVRNALRQYAAEQELARLRAQVRRALVGESPALRALLDQISKVGPTKARVLITGESGSGKELVARAIHESSQRCDGPFVKVNCAAIPAHLIESELFGHEKGAFTGATAPKQGLFEVADGGTLLLDEVGDMAPEAQAKVLRVLQSGEILRVGGRKPRQVDVRVLAATHRDLKALVGEGAFREDLYFRLAVVPIEVPPLRARREDIPILVRHFIDQVCFDNGFAPKEIADEALEALVSHDWPGNVRELRNVVERMVILSDERIEVGDVPPEVRGEGAGDVAFARGADWSASELPLREARDRAERAIILDRLERFDWNVSRTAESLGVERSHLHKKMRTLGIQRRQA
ncbi:MAG: sigma-54-dependent Fis family transcriptional regulator [Deltaproteobacteria bacterium]|nr:MAG: sigma-54-dependent Fis family transcriptional regulator [Deltaproteobacteria bacterium]